MKKFTLIIILTLLASFGYAQEFTNYHKSSQAYWEQKINDPNMNFHELVEEFDAYWAGKTIERKSDYKFFKRWQDYARAYVLPDGSLQSIAEIDAAYEQFVAAKGRSTYEGDWEFVGPSVFPDQHFSNQQPGLGRISAIGFHPNDPNILFAGAPVGGIWKTTDGGQNWFNLNTDHIGDFGVSSIVVNYNNPNIIYLGSGDRVELLSTGRGVLKSINGGNSWQIKNQTLGNKTVNKLLMHPSNPEILVAATNHGIYKTIDGANTWQLVLPNVKIRDMAYKPGSPDRIYAVSAKNVYLSVDQGNSFYVTKSTNNGRMELAVTPAAPDKVFVIAIKDSKFSMMLVSDDSGESYQEINASGFGSDPKQGWYNLVLAADPVNANILYAGLVTVFRSTNGGVHWERIYDAGQIHADQHVFEWSPHANNKLYIGNDGGVYEMQINPTGRVLNAISDGLAITMTYRMNTFPTDPNLVVMGTQDNGSFVKQPTRWWHTSPGDGFHCAYDYTNPSILYTTAQTGRIFRSTNGGASNYEVIAAYYPKDDIRVNGIDQIGSWYSAFTLDVDDPGTMFAGFRDVWRSTNVNAVDHSSIVWENISQGQFNTAPDQVIDIVRQSPSNGNRIFVADNGGYKIFLTLNARSENPTWQQIHKVYSGQTLDIEAHPENDDLFYFTIGKKIVRYNIATQHWTDLTLDLPSINMQSIACQKYASEGLYVGTSRGVYYKNAGMDGWVEYKTGLPRTHVRDLHINYSTDPPQLFAATYGRGLWKTTIYPDPEPNLTALSGNSTVSGTTIFVGCNYKNTSEVGHASPHHIGFYLSENATISSEDWLVDEVSVASLAPLVGRYTGMNATVDVALYSPPLPPGTYYFGAYLDNRYEVKETDEFDNAYLADKQVTIPPPPPPPTNVQASAGTFADKIRISWSPPTGGAAAYQVYKYTGGDVAVPISNWITATQFDDINAEQGIDYSYYVAASLNTAGHRASGLSAEATGWRQLTPPANLLAAKGTWVSMIPVNWATSANATHYMLYRNTVVNTATATPLLATWQSHNSFLDMSAEPGIVYYYWVKAAMGSNGERASGFSNHDSGYISFASAPEVEASDGFYDDRIEVSWTTVAAAPYYKLFYNDIDDPETSTSLSPWMMTTVYSQPNNALIPGKPYYFWVKASNDNIGTITTGYSIVDVGWRDFVKPFNVVATKGTMEESVKLSWTSPQCPYAQVLRNTADAIETANPVTSWFPPNQGFTDYDVTAGADYYYWVRCAYEPDFNIGRFSDSDFGWGHLRKPSVTATSGVFPDKVAISWQPLDGGDAFRIFRSEGSILTPEPITGWLDDMDYLYEDFPPETGKRYTYGVKAAVNTAGNRESDMGVAFGSADQCGNMVDEPGQRHVELYGASLTINQRVVNEGPHDFLKPSVITYRLMASPEGSFEYVLGEVDVPPLDVNEHFDISFTIDLRDVPYGPVTYGTWYVNSQMFRNVANGNCETNFNDDFITWEDHPFEYTDALHGTYTIGGSAGDFNTFTEALDALHNFGVSTPVVFHVEEGLYYEKLVFNAIAGSSAQNTITFTTKPYAAYPATLISTATEFENYTIRFANTGNIVMDNLGITTYGFSNFQSDFGRVIEFVGQCENISIVGCRLEGYTDVTHRSLDNTVVFAANANLSQINIEGNFIENGFAAIFLEGMSLETSPLSNIVIQGNSINNFASYGIRMLYAHHPTIINNRLVSAPRDVNNSYGIDLVELAGGFEIIANHIIMNPFINIITVGISMINVNVTGEPTGLIANNFVNINNDEGSATGILFIHGNMVKLYNNSIHLFGVTGTSPPSCISFYTDQSHASSYNNQLINNILVNNIGGYAINLTEEAITHQYLSQSDYNNIITSGTYPFKYGTAEHESISVWNAVSGFDAHSMSVDPEFASAIDLHANSLVMDNSGIPLAEVTHDIDGEERHATTPDVGADEYTWHPTNYWTGAVSSDWHNPGNWRSNLLPDATTRVYIPEGTLHNPIVSAGASCENMILRSELMVNSGNLLQVNGSLDVYGLLITNVLSGITVSGPTNFYPGTELEGAGMMTCQGDVVWHTGASAVSNANFIAKRDWNMHTGAVFHTAGMCVFDGEHDATITNHSQTARFDNLRIIKTTGKEVSFANESSKDLLINGNLEILAGSAFKGLSELNYRLKGDLLNTGIFQLAGTLVMENTTAIQELQSTSGSSLTNLSVEAGPSTTIQLNDDLVLFGDMLIQSGSFNAGTNTITVYGNWANTPGATGFDAGMGKVVFAKQPGQTANINNHCTRSETFNILEVNNPVGHLVVSQSAEVSCAHYRWLAGGIHVSKGTFTAHDLLNDGLYGYYGTSDLHATINLTQSNGYIDLNGDIFMEKGTINIYGGLDRAHWPYLTNGSISMNFGTINIVDQGLVIFNSNNLQTDITYGEIKIAGDFRCERSDFNPAGLVLFMEGSSNSTFDMLEGSMYRLTINKDDALNSVSLHTDLNSYITNAFKGTFIVNPGLKLRSTELNVGTNGTLHLGEGAEVQLSYGLTTAGFVNAIGNQENPIVFSPLSPSEFFVVDVNSNGTIAAEHTHFVNADIHIKPGGLVDPMHAFHHCVFEQGLNSLLTIDNDQDLVIGFAQFPSISAHRNVTKTNDAGSVLFESVSGEFAGEAFENDLHERINWDIVFRPPYYESFDQVVAPAIPPGFTVLDNNSDGNTWQTSASFPYTAPNAMAIPSGSILAMDDYFFTPGILLQGGEEYKVGFQYSISGSSFTGKLKVLYGTTPDEVGMTGGLLWEHSNITNVPYVYASATFSPPITATYYFGWYAFSDPNNGWLKVDDIAITGPETMQLVFDTELEAGRQVTLPLQGTVNVVIDWGDSTSETVTSPGNHSHTYAADGTYEVSIKGALEQFGNGTDTYPNAAKLLKVARFGDLGLTSLAGAFRNAVNLTEVPTALPDIVTNTSYMFAGATSFNQDISYWFTGNVNNMSYMFAGASQFNHNIALWQTHSVQNMEGMFEGATAFNIYLNNWNVSNVSNMKAMFKNATAFNSWIGSWNTSSVTTMESMFEGAELFNQNISGWNTVNVTNMKNMLRNVESFNWPIGNWNIAKVTDMSGMLQGGKLSVANYNALLISWAGQNVRNNVHFHAGDSRYSPGAAATARNTLVATPQNWTITDGGTAQPMTLVFNTHLEADKQITLPFGGSVNVTVDWGDGTDPVIFNSPGDKTYTYWSDGTYTVTISGTLERFGKGGNAYSNVAKLIRITSFGDLDISNLSGTFHGAINLVEVPGSLPVTCTNVSSMFRNAPAFNLNISGWNTANITDMSNMFRGASSFNSDISQWNTGNVTTMYYMFGGASAFNQNIGGWDVSNAINMREMFMQASSFNQDISNWNTSKVTNMLFMFYQASAFNQDIGAWDITSVTDMTSMFFGVTISNPFYNNLLTGWASKDVKPNVTFHGGNSKYSAGNAANARAILTNAPNNWTITDGGMLACSAPIDLIATSITADGASLAWTEIGLATQWNVEVGLPGFTPGTGSHVWKADATAINPLIVSGLDHSTNYAFHVQADCSGDGLSQWSVAGSFTTACGIYTTPFAENFNTETIPNCWSQTFDGSLSAVIWNISNTNEAGGVQNEMMAAFQLGSGTSRLISPVLDLSSGLIELSFRHSYIDFASGATLKIQSSADGVNWTDEAFAFSSGSGNVNPEVITITLAANSPTSQIAWAIEGDHYQITYWYIDEVNITSTPAVNQLDLKVMLEGPFNGVGAMDDNLSAGGLLPLIQPYDDSPWNYTGSEAVASIPDDVVDWVLIELRDADSPGNATPATTLTGWPKAFFLKNDGSLVDLDGNMPDLGNPVINDNLYIVIRHRNHLDVMSSGPLSLSGSTYTYDFTDAITKAHGGAAGYKQIGAGLYGMVAGDIDADGSITVLDFSDWASAFGITGTYNKADADLDGQVSVLDFSKWAANFGIVNPLTGISQLKYASMVPETE